GNRMDEKVRQVGLGREFLAIAWRVGEIETARDAHAAVVIGEAGNDALDVVADGVVVFGKRRPVDGGVVLERRDGEMTDDGNLAEQVGADRSENAATLLNDSHGVFAAYELLTGFLDVALGATETGKDESLLGGDEV